MLMNAVKAYKLVNDKQAKQIVRKTHSLVRKNDVESDSDDSEVIEIDSSSDE